MEKGSKTALVIGGLIVAAALAYRYFAGKVQPGIDLLNTANKAGGVAVKAFSDFTPLGVVVKDHTAIGEAFSAAFGLGGKQDSAATQASLRNAKAKYGYTGVFPSGGGGGGTYQPAFTPVAGVSLKDQIAAYFKANP